MQTSFPKTEEQILAFWQEKKIFEKTLAKRSPGKSASSADKFVFYDGPPFATGLPHYGHIIAGTIKDVIPRYKTMQGYRVPRRWGWDCHGLPIENLIEQEKGFKEKKEIEQDIAGFNKACCDSVLRYRDEWKKSVDRTGRWVDMENDYKTMDNRYIEVIWWIFKELYRDGFIYEGYKSMHLCPRCETTLSNFEVTLGYKEVKDLAVTVKFRITPARGGSAFGGNSEFLPKDAPVYMLAWTTTPWTLPGNMALAVGEDIEYVIARVLGEAEYVSDEPPRIDDKSLFIIAENVLRKTDKADEYTIEIGPLSSRQIFLEKIGACKSKDLVGLEYKPLFPDSVLQIKDDKHFSNAFKVYAADFVNTEEGTGIVHIAPAFGEDDYQLSLKEKLPFLQHVNYDGTFKEYVSFAPGEKVKTKEDPHGADVGVINYLAEHKLLFNDPEKYSHSYPHCWRCDTPLINYASSSWFVKVTALKDRLLEANSKVKWVPEHIKDGRFGKWLEGARDWAISRSRYWGAPLPVWRCESCKDIKVIGSVAELEQNKTPEKSEVLSSSAKDLSLAGTQKDRQLETTIDSSSDFVNRRQYKEKPAEGLEPSQSGLSDPSARHAADMSAVYQKAIGVAMDLHRPYIDETTFPCDKCGGAMRRISEVFDCWFESGAMPYASEIMFSDYTITPETTRKELRKHIAFPADFIAEGTDQTRGWFYTLMVLGVALYNESPFKNVIVNGIILAEDGQKMSKRLKNYPDPQVIMDKYGADALRFYLMSSPAVRADSLNFSEKGVDEVYKKVILLTLNVVEFWKMYGRNSKLKVQSSKPHLKTQNILDQWILARLKLVVKMVAHWLDKYEIDKACQFYLLPFIDEVSTWYLRRSRDRFKKGGHDQELAGQVLRYVLQELAKILAPITPFLAEYLYQEVGGEKESVHLEEWPLVEELKREEDKIWKTMSNVQKIFCTLAHSIRAEAGIKVRQPLCALQISGKEYAISQNDLEPYLDLIADELNVREVTVVDTLVNSSEWVEKNGIALNVHISDSLKEGGTLRELTRQINNLRKKQGLTIHDRVIVEYGTDSAALQSVIEKYQEELKEAVLAREMRKEAGDRGDIVDIDGAKVSIMLLLHK